MLRYITFTIPTLHTFYVLRWPIVAAPGIYHDGCYWCYIYPHLLLFIVVFIVVVCYVFVVDYRGRVLVTTPIVVVILLFPFILVLLFTHTLLRLRWSRYTLRYVYVRLRWCCLIVATPRCVTLRCLLRCRCCLIIRYVDCGVRWFVCWMLLRCYTTLRYVCLRCYTFVYVTRFDLLRCLRYVVTFDLHLPNRDGRVDLHCSICLRYLLPALMFWCHIWCYDDYVGDVTVMLLFC